MLIRTKWLDDCWSFFSDLAKPEKRQKGIAQLLDEVLLYKDPYGVVLVIGAWNYPVQIMLSPVVGAIAAGNCVIIKPSEVASATAQTIAKLIPQYLDKNCYQVYLGGVPETAELLQQRWVKVKQKRVHGLISS